MELVTKYKANNGKLFNNETDCINYEEKIKRRDEILNMLKPVPLSFDGYVQQDIHVVLKVKSLLLDEIEKELPYWKPDIKRAREIPVNNSILGRILDDSDSIWYYAWCRLMCIDNQGKHWEQPYYTINPGTGSDKEIK